jgi:hypothetical protein
MSKVPKQVNLPFLTLKKEAKERCLLDHCDIVSLPIWITAVPSVFLLVISFLSSSLHIVAENSNA